MKPSVLIVDDEEVICSGLARLLSKNYKTYQALNGKEAIGIINQNKDIDVILCDLTMPGMDGIEMIEKIRAHDKDVYIVVITAAPPQKVCEAIKAGANNFLSKLFDLNQLETMIRNVTRIKNKCAELQAVDIP